MAFYRNEYKGTLLLILFGIPLISSTNINCGGKSFHCLNSTHFMICVDLGAGVSTTVDDFVIPCPPPTVCQGNNRFECEFPASTTTSTTAIPSSIVMKELTTPFIEDVVTTFFPTKIDESHNSNLKYTDSPAIFFEETVPESTERSIVSPELNRIVNNNGTLQNMTENIIKQFVNNSETNTSFGTTETSTLNNSLTLENTQSTNVKSTDPTINTVDTMVVSNTNTGMGEVEKSTESFNYSEPSTTVISLEVLNDTTDNYPVDQYNTSAFTTESIMNTNTQTIVTIKEITADKDLESTGFNQTGNFDLPTEQTVIFNETKGQNLLPQEPLLTDSTTVSNKLTGTNETYGNSTPSSNTEVLTSTDSFLSRINTEIADSLSSSKTDISSMNETSANTTSFKDAEPYSTDSIMWWSTTEVTTSPSSSVFNNNSTNEMGITDQSVFPNKLDVLTTTTDSILLLSTSNTPATRPSLMSTIDINTVNETSFNIQDLPPLANKTDTTDSPLITSNLFYNTSTKKGNLVDNGLSNTTNSILAAVTTEPTVLSSRSIYDISPPIANGFKTTGFIDSEQKFTTDSIPTPNTGTTEKKSTHTELRNTKEILTETTTESTLSSGSILDVMSVTENSFIDSEQTFTTDSTQLTPNTGTADSSSTPLDTINLNNTNTKNTNLTDIEMRNTTNSILAAVTAEATVLSSGSIFDINSPTKNGFKTAGSFDSEQMFTTDSLPLTSNTDTSDSSSIPLVTTNLLNHNSTKKTNLTDTEIRNTTNSILSAVTTEATGLSSSSIFDISSLTDNDFIDYEQKITTDSIPLTPNTVTIDSSSTPLAITNLNNTSTKKTNLTHTELRNTTEILSATTTESTLSIGSILEVISVTENSFIDPEQVFTTDSIPLTPNTGTTDSSSTPLFIINSNNTSTKKTNLTHTELRNTTEILSATTTESTLLSSGSISDINSVTENSFIDSEQTFTTDSTQLTPNTGTADSSSTPLDTINLNNTNTKNTNLTDIEMRNTTNSILAAVTAEATVLSSGSIFDINSPTENGFKTAGSFDSEQMFTTDSLPLTSNTDMSDSSSIPLVTTNLLNHNSTKKTNLTDTEIRNTTNSILSAVTTEATGLSSSSIFDISSLTDHGFIDYEQKITTDSIPLTPNTVTTDSSSTTLAITNLNNTSTKKTNLTHTELRNTTEILSATTTESTLSSGSILEVISVTENSFIDPEQVFTTDSIPLTPNTGTTDSSSTPLVIINTNNTSTKKTNLTHTELRNTTEILSATTTESTLLSSGSISDINSVTENSFIVSEQTFTTDSTQLTPNTGTADSSSTPLDTINLNNTNTKNTNLTDIEMRNTTNSILAAVTAEATVLSSGSIFDINSPTENGFKTAGSFDSEQMFTTDSLPLTSNTDTSDSSSIPLVTTNLLNHNSTKKTNLTDTEIRNTTNSILSAVTTEATGLSSSSIFDISSLTDNDFIDYEQKITTDSIPLTPNTVTMDSPSTPLAITNLNNTSTKKTNLTHTELRNTTEILSATTTESTLSIGSILEVISVTENSFIDPEHVFTTDSIPLTPNTGTTDSSSTPLFIINSNNTSTKKTNLTHTELRNTTEILSATTTESTLLSSGSISDINSVTENSFIDSEQTFTTDSTQLTPNTGTADSSSTPLDTINLNNTHTKNTNLTDIEMRNTTNSILAAVTDEATVLSSGSIFDINSPTENGFKTAGSFDSEQMFTTDSLPLTSNTDTLDSSSIPLVTTIPHTLEVISVTENSFIDPEQVFTTDSIPLTPNTVTTDSSSTPLAITNLNNTSTKKTNLTHTELRNTTALLTTLSATTTESTLFSGSILEVISVTENSFIDSEQTFTTDLIPLTPNTGTTPLVTVNLNNTNTKNTNLTDIEMRNTSNLILAAVTAEATVLSSGSIFDINLPTENAFKTAGSFDSEQMFTTDSTLLTPNTGTTDSSSTLQIITKKTNLVDTELRDTTNSILLAATTEVTGLSPTENFTKSFIVTEQKFTTDTISLKPNTDTTGTSPTTLVSKNLLNNIGTLETNLSDTELRNTTESILSAATTKNTGLSSGSFYDINTQTDIFGQNISDSEQKTATDSIQSVPITEVIGSLLELLSDAKTSTSKLISQANNVSTTSNIIETSTNKTFTTNQETVASGPVTETIINSDLLNKTENINISSTKTSINLRLDKDFNSSKSIHTSGQKSIKNVGEADVTTTLPAVTFGNNTQYQTDNKVVINPVLKNGVISDEVISKSNVSEELPLNTYLGESTSTWITSLNVDKNKSTTEIKATSTLNITNYSILENINVIEATTEIQISNENTTSSNGTYTNDFVNQSTETFTADSTTLSSFIPSEEYPRRGGESTSVLQDTTQEKVYRVLTTQPADLEVITNFEPIVTSSQFESQQITTTNAKLNDFGSTDQTETHIEGVKITNHNSQTEKENLGDRDFFTSIVLSTPLPRSENTIIIDDMTVTNNTSVTSTIVQPSDSVTVHQNLIEFTTNVPLSTEKVYPMTQTRSSFTNYERNGIVTKVDIRTNAHNIDHTSIPSSVTATETVTSATITSPMTTITTTEKSTTPAVTQTTHHGSNPTTKDGHTQNPSGDLKRTTKAFNCLHRKRGRYSDNEDCRKFYICTGAATPIHGLCPGNTVFSEVRNQCTRNLSHCVRENQFKCVSRGRFADYIKPNIYYICVNNGVDAFVRFKFQCQTGYYLDRKFVRCEKNPEDSNSNQSVSNNSDKSTKEKKSSEEKKSKHRGEDFECEKVGKFADPNSCRGYYVCSKSKRSEEFRRRKKKCDSDEVFHKEKRKCVDEESYECSQK